MSDEDREAYDLHMEVAMQRLIAAYKILRRSYPDGHERCLTLAELLFQHWGERAEGYIAAQDVIKDFTGELSDDP